MTRLALAAVGVALLTGCGGGGHKTVADVGNQQITQQQLDALVQHFRHEAQLEGKDFPQDGTKGFVALRNQLLGLLVYRAELQQAADRLGVKVEQDALNQRLAAAQNGGEQEGDSNGDTYNRDSIESELLKEGIAAKVTRDVSGKTAAERAARRNQALAAYLARLQRQTKGRYEPGLAPGSYRGSLSAGRPPRGAAEGEIERVRRVDVGVDVVRRITTERQAGHVVERVPDRQADAEPAVERDVDRDRVAADAAGGGHGVRVVGDLAVPGRRVGAGRRAREELRRLAAGRLGTDVEDPVGLLAGVADRERLEARQPDGLRLARWREHPGQVGDRHLHPQHARAGHAQGDVRQVELRLVRPCADGRVVRPLGVAGDVGHRALRHAVVRLLAGDRLALQLTRLVQVRAVVLARGVVVDDPDRARLVEVEREVVGHRAVTARDRAADPLVADLAVVHRLLGEPLLRDGRRERGRVADRCGVAPPLDRRRALRVDGPAREAVRLARGVGRVPREREVAGRAGLRPQELGRRRRRRADADRRRPALALVGRGRVVDAAVVRVDPGRVDVAAGVDRKRREQVPRIAAARRDRERDVVELDPGALAWRHVADRQADVVALVARGVEVAVLRVEAQLAARRVRGEGERRLGGSALPDEPADRVGRAGRAGARVDERADGRLVERHEDRVVGGRGGRAVVGRVPLAVDGDVLDRERVLAPRVAVVVRDRGAEVDEALEVDEVVVPLVDLEG